MSAPPPAADPTNEADLDQTGRFVRQPNGRIRPLSPHLQIWRWHITMTASILFRVTIGAISFGALIVLGWLAVLACGPDVAARFGITAADAQRLAEDEALVDEEADSEEDADVDEGGLAANG